MKIFSFKPKKPVRCHEWITKTYKKIVPELKIYKRHLFLGTKFFKSLASIQFKTLKIVRDILYEKGFLELISPVVAPISDPGLRMGSMVEIHYYGEKAVLVSSAILYKLAALKVSDKVFFFAPNVREEPVDFVDFGRTLSEIRQIDIEVAKAKREDVIKLSEELLVKVIESVKKVAKEELEYFDRTLKTPHRPFKRIKFHDALEIAREAGFEPEESGELSREGETYISKLYDEPVWIIDYPSGVRGFYYREKGDGTLLDMDLLYPDGFGEAASGGEREVDPIKVRERMIKTGVDPRRFIWLFELLYEGVPECAGIGFGFERLIRFITGVQSIVDAVLFPKVPGYIGI